LWIAFDGTAWRVWLAGIDAPEGSQPFHEHARYFLNRLAPTHATAQVHVVEREGASRLVGRVVLGDVDLGLEMIRAGWAWAYAPEASAEQRAAEAVARNQRIGLWAEADPTAPWVARQAVQARRFSTQPVPGYCKAKRYCAEMQSCAEALGFLIECGMRHLDPDEDGMPCPELCLAEPSRQEREP
jgi:hypothetical protein